MDADQKRRRRVFHARLPLYTLAVVINEVMLCDLSDSSRPPLVLCGWR